MAWIFFFISVLALVWLALLVRHRRRDHLEAEQARAMAFLMENGGAGAAADAAPVPVVASPAAAPGGDVAGPAKLHVTCPDINNHINHCKKYLITFEKILIIQ